MSKRADVPTPMRPRARIIRCEGEVSFDNGNFHGRQVVIFSSTRTGKWYLHIGNQLIEGGRNLSKDEQHLMLNNYIFAGFSGVRAHYDWEKHRLAFRLKYHQGRLGGGKRWTSGTFENCQEYEDELPKGVTDSCAEILKLRPNRS